MSNEITTQVLAKAINKTKKSVQTNDVDIELRINGEKEKFKLIHKSASNDNNQLNAMAIAPVKADGKADYDNVAVVYDGTNSRPSKRKLISIKFRGYLFKSAQKRLKNEKQKQKQKQNLDLADPNHTCYTRGHWRKKIYGYEDARKRLSRWHSNHSKLCL